MFNLVANLIPIEQGNSDTSPGIGAYLAEHIFEISGLIFNLAAVALAAFALWAAIRQLRPLRRTLEEIAAEQQREQRMRATLTPPSAEVRVRGFDPRLDNVDWTRILDPHLRGSSAIRMDLSWRYQEFYEWYERRAERDSDEVIIVDLLLMPMFLQTGLIVPLNEIISIDEVINKRADLYGARHSTDVRELMRLLCTDVNGLVGALPLWINTHGRYLPDTPFLRETDWPIAAETDFGRLLRHRDAARLLTLGGVQSSYLAFEFWAHLAYRGGTLFSAKRRPGTFGQAIPSSGGGELTCRLFRSDHEWRVFAEAAADLSTRLQFCAVTRETFADAEVPADFEHEPAFRVGHVGEARMIRNGVFFWKPVCSSELLRKIVGRRDDQLPFQLNDDTCFKPPYVNRHSNNRYTYASSVGGYGLALPSKAATSPNARQALEFMFLANPALCHSYLNDMVEDSQMSVQEFADRHARPPIPFWRSLEHELNYLLFNLMLRLDRTKELAISPEAFWVGAKNTFLDPVSRKMIEDFVGRVCAITVNNGWEFHETPT